jgi:hypothetical protein
MKIGSGKPPWMRRVLILALTGVILCPSAAIRAGEELVRVTTSFDVRHVGAVLRQVSKLFGTGFERREADRLAREIDKLKADQPQVWDYQVTWQGASRPLKIRAVIDDLGNVDLDFATSEDLAPLIRRGVDGYLNSRGL